MLGASFLVMLMQLGFALVNSGFTRAQNVAHTISSSFLLYAIGILGYWVCGFGFQMGGVLAHEIRLPILGHQVGWIGFSGFAVSAARMDASVLTLFLFQVMLMAASLVIPTGALAERWRFGSLALYGIAMSMVVYPIFGNWIWGGGWLSRLGGVGLGHGTVDFAGGSVVHLVGGTAALAGAIVLGPRMRKFTRDGRPLAIPGHNIPMAIAGTLILGFGWFGLNTGAASLARGDVIALVAINTALASAASAVAATAFVWWRFGTPDPSIMSNGFLAGLVAISAGCAFVSTPAALVIGLVAGTLVVLSVFFVERNLRVDDPVGVVSIHGTCGFWGLVAVGLFADGSYGQGWNGVAGPVRGLFYGDASQLLAQTLGGLVCVAYVFAVVYLLFKLFDQTIGNRVAPEAESEGLDVGEMGTVAYPDFSMAPARHEPMSFFERPPQ
jgi:Amt family ammonium transporter